MPGGPNEHVLNEIGGSWEAATVTGILREEGWGAEMGYPGIVPDEHGSEIQGFLFSSEKLSDHFTFVTVQNQWRIRGCGVASRGSNIRQRCLSFHIFLNFSS